MYDNSTDEVKFYFADGFSENKSQTQYEPIFWTILLQISNFLFGKSR